MILEGVIQNEFASMSVRYGLYISPRGCSSVGHSSPGTVMLPEYRLQVLERSLILSHKSNDLRDGYKAFARPAQSFTKAFRACPAAETCPDRVMIIPDIAKIIHSSHV